MVGLSVVAGYWVRGMTVGPFIAHQQFPFTARKERFGVTATV